MCVLGLRKTHPTWFWIDTRPYSAKQINNANFFEERKHTSIVIYDPILCYYVYAYTSVIFLNYICKISIRKCTLYNGNLYNWWLFKSKKLSFNLNNSVMNWQFPINFFHISPFSLSYCFNNTSSVFFVFPKILVYSTILFECISTSFKYAGFKTDDRIFIIFDF